MGLLLSTFAVLSCCLRNTKRESRPTRRAQKCEKSVCVSAGRKKPIAGTDAEEKVPAADGRRAAAPLVPRSAGSTCPPLRPVVGRRNMAGNAHWRRTIEHYRMMCENMIRMRAPSSVCIKRGSSIALRVLIYGAIDARQFHFPPMLLVFDFVVHKYALEFRSPDLAEPGNRRARRPGSQKYIHLTPSNFAHAHGATEQQEFIANISLRVAHSNSNTIIRCYCIAGGIGSMCLKSTLIILPL